MPHPLLHYTEGPVIEDNIEELDLSNTDAIGIGLIIIQHHVLLALGGGKAARL